MKRLLVLLLLGALLLLTACGGGDVTTTTVSSTTTTVTTTTQPPTQPPAEPERDKAAEIDTLEKYNAYIAENGAASNFISYEKIAALGQFAGFLGDTSKSYRYAFLCDSIQYPYYVTFLYQPASRLWEFLPESEEFPLITESPTGTDLRSLFLAYPDLNEEELNPDLLYAFYLHGIRYCYFKNRSHYILHSIDILLPDGTSCAISVQKSLGRTELGKMDMHNPLDCDCLLSKFLHADTCQQAKETLIASIFGAE